MSVYVDQARSGFGRMIMCHMVADSLDELHEMAAAIGMRREWFQPRSFPHYDVCQMRRTRAVELGAVEVNRRELALLLRRLRTVTDTWLNPPCFSTGGGLKAGSSGPIKSPSERSDKP